MEVDKSEKKKNKWAGAESFKAFVDAKRKTIHDARELKMKKDKTDMEAFGVTPTMFDDWETPISDVKTALINGQKPQYADYEKTITFTAWNQDHVKVMDSNIVDITIRNYWNAYCEINDELTQYVHLRGSQVFDSGVITITLSFEIVF